MLCVQGIIEAALSEGDMNQIAHFPLQLKSQPTSAFAWSHVNDMLCVQGIIEAALSEGDMKQIACPHPSCRLPLPLQLALSLLNSSAAQRYQQLLAQHHVDTSPLIKW